MVSRLSEGKKEMIGDLEIKVKYLGKWLFRVKAEGVKQEHLEHKIDQLCVELQMIIHELRKGNVIDLIKNGTLEPDDFSHD